MYNTVVRPYCLSDLVRRGKASSGNEVEEDTQNHKAFCNEYESAITYRNL